MALPYYLQVNFSLILTKLVWNYPNREEEFQCMCRIRSQLLGMDKTISLFGLCGDCRGQGLTSSVNISQLLGQLLVLRRQCQVIGMDIRTLLIPFLSWLGGGLPIILPSLRSLKSLDLLVHTQSGCTGRTHGWSHYDTPGRFCTYRGPITPSDLCFGHSSDLVEWCTISDKIVLRVTKYQEKLVTAPQKISDRWWRHWTCC